MGDLAQLGVKLGIASPKVLRKAKEYFQLLDVRSNNTSLAALKLTGSCRSVACLHLAAGTFGQVIDKTHAARLAGMTVKLYMMSLKALESMLGLEDVKTVRELAVQLGCTGAVTLAQNVLQMFEDQQRSVGDGMDYNTSLFQGTALCAACRQLKVRVDRAKLKEMCCVKKSCFDALVLEMGKLAEQIDKAKGCKHAVNGKKRGVSLMDVIEEKIQEDGPEKKQRFNEGEEEQKTNYEDWKKKILERAAAASS